MTKDYHELVDCINRTEHFISMMNTDVQKKVAIAMWRYVADNLDELYDILTYSEIEDGDIDIGYDAMEEIKGRFSKKFEKDTGLVIDWRNHCILCEYFSMKSISKPCDICPLNSCASYTENPFHTLVMYAMHAESRNAALSAIDTIIRVIKEVRL